MAPSALDKAIHDRNSAIAMINYLEKELNDHATTALTEAEVVNLVEMSKTHQSEIIKVHKAIIQCGPADPDVHEAEYYTLLKRVNKLVAGFTGIKMTISTASTATPLSTEIRLPRMELPSFDGSLSEWISFRDIFTNAVHNNTKLSKSQKLQYLKSSLKGEAARVISSIIVSDANYDIAWNQLCDRYQNDREILYAILRKFYSQPQVQAHSSQDVRRLLDVSQECIRQLEVLKLPVDKWDAILHYNILQKLDSVSKELWEQGLRDSSIPTLKSLLEFLAQRARALAASGLSTSQKSKAATSSNHTQDNRVTRSQSRPMMVHHTNSTKCPICEEDAHPLFKCEKFKGLPIQQRTEAVKKLNICFNCFRDGHRSSNCPSDKRCRTCNANHNTLLHRPKQNGPTGQTREDAVAPVVYFTTHSSPAETPNEYDTLLATAMVQVSDKFGQTHMIRVLADNGSNTNFITDSCIRRIGAMKKRYVSTAVGLGGSTVATSTGLTSLTVSPHFDNSISFPISKCLITTKITGKLPLALFDHKRWSHLQNLQLADPTYHQPQDVDLLLGAEFFFAIIKGKILSGPPNSPVALDTSFGWLIGGGSVPLITHQVHTTHTTIHHDTTTDQSTSTSSTSNLDSTLRRFWEIESVPTERLRTVEEIAVEAHFLSTYTRDETGRFIVKLPFKSSSKSLGHSLKMATNRLHLLERRLARNPQYRKEYNDFMHEYESLGHMTEVQAPQQDSNSISYLPHHFVLKESSTTTKFRVVFDASAKTTTGISLNNTLMVGPTLQDSLVDIIIRFRLHKIAYTADIAKMFRQILVSPQDRDMQRILWRDDPSKPIRHFQLRTVTYGTASASYDATRVVQEVATLGSNSMPRAAAVAKRDLYMDDLMSGEPSEEEALATQAELMRLMESGSFTLRKWASNSEGILQALPQEMRETESLLTFDTDSSIKALGICWNLKTDVFMFKIAPLTTGEPKLLTKRSILSEIAKLFDPIGWLAPVIINAKIMMQQLWKLDLHWDAELPDNIQQQWITFRHNLEELNSLTINRFYFHGTELTCPSLNCPFATNTKFCIAGFCDASEKAYAAAVYLCSYNGSHKSVTLITSKTRVAPAKQVSLPRLELCGSNLLADLITAVKKAIKIPIHSVAAFTDSTVTLAWIQSHPSRWKTFVANRVTKVQEQIEPGFWGYVPSAENPADCASRGIGACDLMDHPLWWTGPHWLMNGIPSPTQHVELDYAQAENEARPPIIHHIMLNPEIKSLLDRYSSFTRLTRVTAFIFRFTRNCRIKGYRMTLANKPCFIPLSVSELTHARHHWVKTVQLHAFPEEIKKLRKGVEIPTNSKITSLSAFLDSDAVLRVGGRLKNSYLSHDRKHPIILPYHSRLTQLLIEEEHRRSLHAGPQLLLSILQQRYWIIRARDAVRYHTNKCVLCTRHKARTQQQMMADLPTFRVTHARPFLKTGIDYAGPFLIRPIQPRSKTTMKAYLAIYVCCVTRAVHLDAVSSLTTEAFLASLRRFVARRGIPSDIHSDNGTNFIGADNDMKEMANLLHSQLHNKSIADEMSKQGISWNFLPPASPNFGGLWEAGVKSTKYHLRSVTGEQRLTFEELTTVLTQIEAILNSRPLTPESADPDDLNALTPGHFLIGAPLTAIPEPFVDHIPLNRLSRWQMLQQMVQSFWKRWSNEYLTRLQQRPKWLKETKPIATGDLVLIKEENLPPLKWRLGRVIALHPGPDAIVRVVTLRTSTGELKRPICKLSLLPIDNPIQPSSSTDSENLVSF